MGGSTTSESGRSGAARFGGRRLQRVGRLTGRISVAVAIGALTLPLATAAAVVAGTGAPAAAANPALTCSAGTIYNLMSNGNFYALNTTTAVNTAAAPTTLGPSTSTDNALGISSDGKTAYSMSQSVSGGKVALTVTTISTDTVANYSVAAGSITNNIAGGVDPVNGEFYYGGWNSADTVFSAFVFNAGTGTGTEVGTITPGGQQGSGDLAFDGLGNLYVLAGNGSNGQIDEVNAASIPASGTSALTFKDLANLTGNADYDGIAFSADGFLYAETGSGGLYEINPNSGALVSSHTQTGYRGTPIDLASCAYNGTLTLDKNIVGRVGTGDQFTMTITGGGITTGNTGTTSGTTTGPQTGATEEAGPVVGIPGTAYSIAETGASGANLANYSSSYNCTSNGGAFASGNGTSATLPTFPQTPPNSNSGATVACTFTNTPASIKVVKTPSVTSVNAPGNMFTYSFAISNTGPVALTKVGVTDAQAAPSVAANLGAISCTGGTNGSISLAVGGSTTCTATYTVSQADIGNGTINDTATASGTAPGGGVVTGTSSASVKVVANPEIALSKTVNGVAGPLAINGPTTLNYAFTASNPGNETLSGVDITDSANFTGLSALSCAGAETNGSITLAAGASETCTATESVSQAQIDAGTSLVDTASVTGTSPAGVTPATVTASSAQVTVTITQNPSLKVVKTASVSSVTAANQTFTYTFAVNNNGNVTESNIGIADTQTLPSVPANLGPITCTQTTLAPGASTNCTATYTVSQADMDNGTITDTAQATGKAPNGSATTSPGSSATVTATQGGAITITKSASVSSVSAPGSVTYTFTIKNTGNVSLTNGDISDTANFAGLSALSCNNSETNGSIALAVGASETCTATESVTQAQIDAGTSLVDTASVTAATPASDTRQPTVGASSSQVTVTITQNPSLKVVKTASVSSVSASGQTFTYTFAVNNNGNVTESNIGITDNQTLPSLPANLGRITCTLTTLAPGASTNCTATYTVSQADMNAGSINDTANATGTAPNGSTTTSPGAGATVSATQAGSILVLKVSSVSSVSAPGPVTYTFTVTNNGNVSLTNGDITDNANFTGLSALSCANSETNGSIALGVGASETCTATESVSQAQIDAGTSLVDTASATASTPPSDTSQPSVSANSSPVTVTITQNPSLKVTKSASVSSVSASGQTFMYTFAVNNNGNVTESNIAIADTQTRPSVPANLGPITCTLTTLAPGASTNCTATYTVSQADMDNGSIGDTADATGTAPNGSTTTSPGSGATVTATQSGAITITKSASAGSVSAPGPVTYTFTVKNTGNVSLTGATIGDSANFTGLSALGCANSETNGSIALAVGASETCTATESVTQAQIDAGTSLVDTASVTAATPASDTTTPSVSAGSNQVTVTITQNPSLQVLKTASASAVTAAGQTFTYTFAVNNNGNVTESNIGITDTQSAPSVPANLGPITCTQTTLAPGASTNCMATYTVSQADMDNGSINDTADATGTAPNGSTTTSPGSGATVTATQGGAITISKTASASALSAPGTVTYTFTVKNTGNVSLTGANIADNANFTGLSALSCNGNETNGSITLAVGASETCTATESVTQTQIDAGTSLVDTASVTAATPASDTAQPSVGASSSQVTVTITQNPSLKVVKTASVSSVSAAGQTYTYTFAVTNNGNVTESNIGIADTQSTPSVAANLGPITCTLTTLAPGASTNCTATYTVSQADMDAGSIGDTARATGTAPNGSTTTSPPYGAVVTTVQNPSLSLTKSASVTQVSQVGQQVTYTFAVKNTGNVTVNAIAIADTQSAPSVVTSLGPINCTQSSLAPGASTNCTATYTVTQVDLNHGSITDTATASGKTTIGTAVKSNSSSVTIQAVQTIMSGRAFDIGLDVGVTGVALVGPVTVNDTGGVETALNTTTPTPCVAAAAVKDLAITGDVCAGVTTTTNPSVSTATSSIANVALGVPAIPAVDLQAVQSTSTTSCAGSSGSVTIAYLSVGGVVVISKPTVIAPNTGLSLGVVSLVLNQQIPFNVGGDKGLTVNAVHVQVDALGLAGVDLVVGSSTSDIECAVPTQAPVLTGEANDVDLLGAALGTTVGANVVVNDTSPVITNQASTTTPACVASAAVVDLTLTGNVCASVTTTPTVGTTPASSTATASVANLVTGLGIPVITLKAVQSTSTTSCTASSGSVTIAYLEVGTTVVIAKPTTILPNTRVVVGPVTLILNQQIAFNGADTGLTVNAVAISVTTGGLVTAFGTIASSTSDILDC